MLQQDEDRPLAVPHEHAAVVSRISNAFFLESAVAHADFFKGELVTALVFLAIVHENARHIEYSAFANGRPPVSPADSEREPVTIYVIAKVLGLTYETARRHVKRLVDDGFCLRMERGLLVPDAVLARPDVVRANERSLANFNLLLNNAVNAGLIAVALKTA